MSGPNLAVTNFLDHLYPGSSLPSVKGCWVWLRTDFLEQKANRLRMANRKREW